MFPSTCSKMVEQNPNKKTHQIFWGRFHVIYAEASGVATHYPFMAKSLKIGPFFSPFYLLLKPNGEFFILSTVRFILYPMFMNKWSFGQFCNVPVKQQQIHFTLIVAPQLPVGENPWIDSGHFGGNPCSLMGQTGFHFLQSKNMDTTLAAIALFTAPSKMCWVIWVALGSFPRTLSSRFPRDQRCQPTHWGAPLWECHVWDQKRHWFFW